MKRFIFVLVMAAAFYALGDKAVEPAKRAVADRAAQIEEALQ